MPLFSISEIQNPVFGNELHRNCSYNTVPTRVACDKNNAELGYPYRLHTF